MAERELSDCSYSPSSWIRIFLHVISASGIFFQFFEFNSLPFLFCNIQFLHRVLLEIFGYQIRLFYTENSSTNHTIFEEPYIIIEYISQLYSNILSTIWWVGGDTQIRIYIPICFGIFFVLSWIKCRFHSLELNLLLLIIVGFWNLLTDLLLWKFNNWKIKRFRSISTGKRYILM